MTKQQKVNVIINCVAVGIEVTPKKLAQLEYERRNRKDLDRFFFNRIKPCQQ